MAYRYPMCSGRQAGVDRFNEHPMESRIHSQQHDSIPASAGLDGGYVSNGMPFRTEASRGISVQNAMESIHMSSPDGGLAQQQHNEAQGHPIYPNVANGWFAPYVPMAGVPVGMNQGVRIWPSNEAPSNPNTPTGPSQQAIPNGSTGPVYVYAEHTPHSGDRHGSYVFLNPYDGQSRNASAEPYESSTRNETTFHPPRDVNARRQNLFPIPSGTPSIHDSLSEAARELIAPSPTSPSGESMYSTANLEDGNGSTSNDSPLSSGVRLSREASSAPSTSPQEPPPILIRQPFQGRTRGPPPGLRLRRATRSRPSIYTVPEAEGSGNGSGNARGWSDVPGIPVTININIECKLVPGTMEVGNVRVEVRRPANTQAQGGQRSGLAVRPRAARVSDAEEDEVKEGE